MKKFIYLITAMLLVCTGNMMAQEAELTRAQEKELQAKIDSIYFEKAVEAINQKNFTLEADRITFKRGRTEFVTSNTNFISVKGDRAVIQIAISNFNAGPNGLGGITVEGTTSSYQVEKSKKGNIILEMNVTGKGVSARVRIEMRKGSNIASADVMPNFNSNNMTLTGVLINSDESQVFKGTSL